MIPHLARAACRHHRHRFGRSLLALSALVVLSACASGPAPVPEPRPLVLHSGARLSIDDEERLQSIYESLERQLDAIEQDPTFMLIVNDEAQDVYPWETLEITNDTAFISFQRTAPDLMTAYEVYAHLHLMSEMGRLDEWLPDALGKRGWELEEAILTRVADVWTLGRVSFDLAPYRLMDQLSYAREAGYLDALLLTLRASEFADARAAWLEANPGRDEAFRAWFRQTFEEDPPEVPSTER